LKDKILFWVDEGFEQLGIAKLMQEYYDFVLSVIFDFNTTKKSFENQNIVKFKKTWFFWDHIFKNSKKPDIEYLKQFEKKYNINLWNSLLNERIFYKYNTNYKFTRNELLSILEQECKFFEKVLDEVNPEFIIIKITDLHRNQLFSDICKARKCKVLMLIPTKFGYRTTISSELNKMDKLWKDEKEISGKSFSELREYMKKFDRFKQTKDIETGGLTVPITKKIKLYFKFLQICNNDYRKSYDHYGATKLKITYNRIFEMYNMFKRKKFLDNHTLNEINGREKFVYFPLHVEPERNLLIDAPYYTNQLEVIMNIAKALPVEYKLYVKEHYNMKFRGWRDISFYKNILDLPNVELIHPSVTPEKIIKSCSLVITIAGTAGLEALFFEKPAIVFANTVFSEISSVHRIESYEELPNAIRTSLKKKVNPNELSEFVNIIHKNSFIFDVFGLHNEITHRFHNDGFLQRDDISINELNIFFEENKEKLKVLADEYVKKINQLKST
jgi:hypothetical protein